MRILYEQRTIKTSTLLPAHIPHIRWRDVTDLVKEFLSRNNAKEGLCNIVIRHSTARLILQENEAGLVEHDIPFTLMRLFPEGEYKHDRPERLAELNGEPKNAPSHLRSLFFSQSVTLPIIHGVFDLGTWTQILFFDFDPTSHKERLLTYFFMGE